MAKWKAGAPPEYPWQGRGNFDWDYWREMPVQEADATNRVEAFIVNVCDLMVDGFTKQVAIDRVQRALACGPVPDTTLALPSFLRNIEQWAGKRARYIAGRSHRAQTQHALHKGRINAWLAWDGL